MQKLRLEALGRTSLENFKAKEKFPLVIVLDNVRSALNVGSSFRTADAFAIEKIICIGITATPPHREILKTALGSTDSVQWDYFESIESAKISGIFDAYTCLAIEQTSESKLLNEYVFDRNKRYAMFFGNEVDGVSEQVLSICEDALEIPQFGTKHSLNVSVCIGILNWEFIRQTVFPAE